MRQSMTRDEAVERLDAIDMADDPERAHGDADDILLAAVSPDVRHAYNRLVERTGRWWYA